MCPTIYKCWLYFENTNYLTAEMGTYTHNIQILALYYAQKTKDYRFNINVVVCVFSEFVLKSTIKMLPLDMTGGLLEA